MLIMTKLGQGVGVRAHYPIRFENSSDLFMILPCLGRYIYVRYLQLIYKYCSLSFITSENRYISSNKWFDMGIKSLELSFRNELCRQLENPIDLLTILPGSFLRKYLYRWFLQRIYKYCSLLIQYIKIINRYLTLWFSGKEFSSKRLLMVRYKYKYPMGRFLTARMHIFNGMFKNRHLTVLLLVNLFLKICLFVQLNSKQLLVIGFCLNRYLIVLIPSYRYLSVQLFDKKIGTKRFDVARIVKNRYLNALLFGTNIKSNGIVNVKKDDSLDLSKKKYFIWKKPANFFMILPSSFFKEYKRVYFKLQKHLHPPNEINVQSWNHRRHHPHLFFL